MRIAEIKKLREELLELVSLSEEWMAEAESTREREAEHARRMGRTPYWSGDHKGTRLSGALRRRMLDLQQTMIHVRRTP